MSTESAFLALRLKGPLQSWGFDSQYNRRNTGLMPTKSAIGGMCCAALGFPRGSEDEQAFLVLFTKLKMTAIAIPCGVDGKRYLVRRMQDYHTVQNTRKAEGGIKDCHITHRQYLTDASFGILLAGDGTLLNKIADALVDPVWGLWLGRKTCIPSAPLFVGLEKSREDALRLLVRDQPLGSFTHQVDAEDFAEGRDSLPDNPVSFDSDRRRFSPRRVRTEQGSSST